MLRIARAGASNVVTGEAFAAGDVERLLAGDAAAAAAFEARFSRLLRMKVRVRNGRASASYVDDVVQETLARVLAALREGKVHDLARLGAFVSRTGDFVMSESHRLRSRFRPLSDAHEPAASDDPEEQVVLRERARLADGLMSALSARDRDVLHALFAEEADKDEVCRRFGVDRNHLRVLVCRAKDRLRALVERSPDAKLSRDGA